MYIIHITCLVPTFLINILLEMLQILLITIHYIPTNTQINQIYLPQSCFVLFCGLNIFPFFVTKTKQDLGGFETHPNPVSFLSQKRENIQACNMTCVHHLKNDMVTTGLRSLQHNIVLSALHFYININRGVGTIFELRVHNLLQQHMNKF